jgi:N-acetyltransferase
MMTIEPVTLTGHFVSCVPLTIHHVDALAKVGLEPSLWQWVPTVMQTREHMQGYVEAALAEQARGVSLPFVVIDNRNREVVGCTRYGNIDRLNHRLEIGWTWYAPKVQRTAVNSDTKFLLLSHAFDTLAVNRVELKTDALNARSRAAIARIGATQEGIFRQHMVIPNSTRLRDTVYFSIIKPEWPGVKQNLLLKLQKPT